MPAANRSQPALEPGYIAGVLFSRAYEAGGLEDALAERTVFEGQSFRVCLGRLGAFPLIICYPRIGALPFSNAAEALSHGYAPRWMISAGFAGALDSELGVGEVVAVSSLCGAGVSLPEEVTRLEIPAELREWFRESKLPSVRLACLSQPPVGLEEKRHVGERTGAAIYDCTGPDLVQFCRSNLGSTLVVRVVSEAFDEVPSPEANWIESQKSWAGRAGAIIGSILRKGGFKATWRLFERRLMASDQLARFIVKLINKLADIGATGESALRQAENPT
ncbi:MAG: hypothetical protein NZ899_03470 [Thermoguttaceae bacterium]|nr:hypothetical protein [Thermoguttaceae bacterium]MDW8078824.1 hypothetical protein [Thermoguttaceae bacterium]